MFKQRRLAFLLFYKSRFGRPVTVKNDVTA